jgi:TRAP-type C4-dicarboxylate transport system substrate-binding protein
MAKGNKSAGTQVSALSPEEFQKLTPEEQTAILNAAVKAQTENQELKAQVKKVKSEVKKELPSFEVEGEGEDEGKTLTYKFVVPLFHIDKNEYTAHEAAEKEEVCAHLVKIGSGIIELVEEGGN